MQPSSHTVTAIVVAHDGARWLRETLEAVLRQSRPVDRVVGIDNGSRDGGADLLGEAFGPANVLTMPRSTGFGEAVAEAVKRLPEAPGQEWIWLIHDDCAPEFHALAALLWAADQDETAAILGPKLRDWLDRRVLLEIGVTVDRSGRRDTGLEPWEYDQGQHDRIRNVLSVSTAGMLIRRDVWEELGGLDPGLPLFRDDLDLCWRAHTAGYRVLNVTDAVAYHAEAASRRRRRITASQDHPRRLDRRNAMFVIMANLPFRPLLWSLFRNIVGSLLRTLLLLLAKQPANALDEISALSSVLAHPIRLIRARKARARGRKKGYPAVKRLFTSSGMAYRRLADMVQGYLSGDGPIESAGRHHAVMAESSGEEGEELLMDAGVMQRLFSNPGVLLTLALTAVTVAAERSVLMGEGLLGGGALTPVTGGGSDLWQLYTSAYHFTGLGSDAWTPPYVTVLAALSALFLGKTSLAVSVLLLGCVPLAGLAAYLATRTMISYRPARVWLAASYGLLPVAMGVISQGRLGSAVVFVLLPIYALLAGKVLWGERRASRRAAWGLGLLLAVGTAFVPLVYVLVGVLGVLATLLRRGRRRRLAVSLAVALGTPIALLFPWLVQIAAEPGRLLLDAGLRQESLADPRLPPESLLMLGPGGPGTPPFWVTGGLFALALVAVVMRSRRTIVAVGWGVAAFGILAAIGVSRISIDGIQVWPGVPLAVAALGLLVASALPAHRITELRAKGRTGRLGAALVALLACASPLAAAGLWIYTGVSGPLTHHAQDLVPAFSAPGGAGRTLVLRDRSGVLAYAVLRGRMPLLGEADLAPPGAARDRFGVAVAGLASGRGGGDAGTLAGFGIEFVTVPGPVAVDLRRALDSDPALVRVSLSKAFGVWRMAAPVGRVWLADERGQRIGPPLVGGTAGGDVVAGVDKGTGTRTLVIAEPAGGWSATIGGTRLASRTVDGWAQGFDVPVAGGTVTISHDDGTRKVWLWAQALIVLMALVLASPGGRTAEAAEEQAAVGETRGSARRRSGRQRSDPPETDGRETGAATERPETERPETERPETERPEAAGVR